MPSRLVLSWPGCTTSAATERSTSPPTARRSSVTGAARVRPLAVSMFDVVVEHFERQAGRLGVVAGQHHRARAGVEHHRHAHAVDLRADVEVAVTVRATSTVRPRVMTWPGTIRP